MSSTTKTTIGKLKKITELNQDLAELENKVKTLQEELSQTELELKNSQISEEEKFVSEAKLLILLEHISEELKGLREKEVALKNMLVGKIDDYLNSFFATEVTNNYRDFLREAIQKIRSQGKNPKILVGSKAKIYLPETDLPIEEVDLEDTLRLVLEEKDYVFDVPHVKEQLAISLLKRKTSQIIN